MAFRIPFSALPPSLLMRQAKKIRSVGNSLLAYFPGLEENLLQAEIDVPAREYAAAALITSLVNFIALFFILFLVITFKMKSSPLTPFLLSAAVGVFNFLVILFYPKIKIARKVRQLENRLIPAVRQMLIELRSGVPLFNAMTSVCDDYGEVSREFRKIVKKINGGIPEMEAISEAARANASHEFRKVLWQISNALKVGSDVSVALESILNDLLKEKVNKIHRYGQELSPWTMMYMLIAVILPSLGITMVIIIVSFMNITVPKILLALTAAFLIGFQLFFMNMVSTRRPMI
ncbi:type II secretion system F family protein [Candidatus Micrarchaeota archaeon]|nr:type II secretion system F family protein [Candidatus Micrarchaeota archaeon]